MSAKGGTERECVTLSAWGRSSSIVRALRAKVLQ